MVIDEAGQQLVQIHDHLRGELRQILDQVDPVEAGRLPLGDARHSISRTTLRQNSWTLGAYCASYCRVLTTHHAIEDRSMFPNLVALDDAAIRSGRPLWCGGIDAACPV